MPGNPTPRPVAESGQEIDGLLTAAVERAKTSGVPPAKAVLEFLDRQLERDKPGTDVQKLVAFAAYHSL